MVCTGDRVCRAEGPPLALPDEQATLVRFVLLTRGLDACQDRKAQQYDPAHRDPVLGDMQYDGAINKPADYDQKSNDVKAE